MLEFIVLGQIPGTNTYLSFDSTLIFICSVLAVILLAGQIRVELPKQTKKNLQKIHEITI
jgi:hypothetical protein